METKSLHLEVVVWGHFHHVVTVYIQNKPGAVVALSFSEAKDMILILFAITIDRNSFIVSWGHFPYACM